MSTPNRVLILSLEPSEHYPDHARAATELVPNLIRELQRDDGPRYEFVALPFLYGAAGEKARYAVAEHEPDYVFLLTNEPNNMEILLHRYAAPRYEVDFPDNSGAAGELPNPEGVPYISKSEVFQLHQAWEERSSQVAGSDSSLAHVTLAMSGDGGVESETYRAIVEAYNDEPMVVARLGVPPIAPHHEILQPETLARTLAFLMETEYQLQS